MKQNKTEKTLKKEERKKTVKIKKLKYVSSPFPLRTPIINYISLTLKPLSLTLSLSHATPLSRERATSLTRYLSFFLSCVQRPFSLTCYLSFFLSDVY